MNLEIDIQVACEGDKLPVPADFKRWVSAALGRERGRAELSIRIVDERESRELNRRYRGIDKPTNVLSFPADLPAELELPLLGDLAICAPVVWREARMQHKIPEAHWAHIVVHGTLHLLGYDHIEDEEAAIMEDLETAILTGLGYAAPYAEELPAETTE